MIYTKNQYPKGTKVFFDAVAQGCDGIDITARFEDAVYNRGAAALSTLRPALTDRLFGQPFSEKNLLVDVCVPFRFVEALHDNVGRARYWQFTPRMKTNAPDMKLLKYARGHDYDAVVTCDGAYRYDSDMCKIAQRYFENPRANFMPPVIVVPRIAQDRLDGFFRERREQIAAIIDHPYKAFYDLRV